ncbi:hypothetical protein VPIG_00080 [Vibrio phage PWH3a-P1]|uniref:hypothetical protein n=1 Tax=Vibrio phage PWH3a-P1 TaxID=754058 RepID=UPI0002C0DB94|nr:hypothetical protein VPIG_00080 [Vibrio phage PWH3a-P1]AGH31938.1 hypothetical protein VPIG_00080 [Vibrio phage PWH3a-P1]
MGRGIAPLLAKANPQVRKVDNDTVVGDKAKLGTFTRTGYTISKPIVYNIYGQYHWNKYKVAPNRNTDYDALMNGLVAVKENMKYHQQVVAEDIGELINLSLGLPLIGCGLAGGDWGGIVFPMIEEIFTDSGIEVTIFKL